VVRYFTDESFAFTEEFSVFLMVVLAFAGASAAFVRNSHIRVTFFVEKLAPRRALAVELAVIAVTIALFAAIGGYGVRLAMDDLRFETTSPGIGVPQWLYSIWLPLLSAVIVMRLAGRVARLLIGGAWAWPARARCCWPQGSCFSSWRVRRSPWCSVQPARS